MSLSRRRFIQGLSAAMALGTAAGCGTTAPRKPAGRVVVIGAGYGGATAAKYIRMWSPDIEVTLDANGFSGEGDIGLFGEMLSRFFALYADIDLFNQLTLILQPTGKCLRWNENHSQRITG